MKKIIYILIVLIILAAVAFFALNFNSGTGAEQACRASGGEVGTLSCCQSAGDFPNSCLIGACGCSPSNSKEVKFCDCGNGKCFDGEKCVELGGESCTDNCGNGECEEVVCMAIGCPCAESGETCPQDCQKTEADFEKTGNLVAGVGTTFGLLYEEPGKPALLVMLNFTGQSICKSDNSETSCVGSGIGDIGDRVRIRGYKVGADSVTVLELEHL